MFYKKGNFPDVWTSLFPSKILQMSAPWWSTWQGRIYLKREPLFASFPGFPLSRAEQYVPARQSSLLHCISLTTLALPKKFLAQYIGLKGGKRGLTEIKVQAANLGFWCRGTLAFGIYRASFWAAQSVALLGGSINSYWLKAADAGGGFVIEDAQLAELNECKVCYLRAPLKPFVSIGIHMHTDGGFKGAIFWVPSAQGEGGGGVDYANGCSKPTSSSLRPHQSSIHSRQTHEQLQRPSLHNTSEAAAVHVNIRSCELFG